MKHKNTTKNVRTVKTSVAFRKIFFALSKQTGCPVIATNKYYNLLKNGIKNNGAGYLKILAAQPILGLRVLGNDVPCNSDFGLTVRSRTGFPILFAWHYQELNKLCKLEPSKQNALQAQRVLTVLSIGKMLTLSSAKRIKSEHLLYAERTVKRLNHSRIRTYRELHSHEIKEFLKFLRYEGRDVSRLLNDHNITLEKGLVGLDPSCYSLKSLSKRTNRQAKITIPEAVVINLMRRSLLDFTQGSTHNATALCRRIIPDGKQSVIVEPGGKFRCITSYYSPLIHSATVYRTLRRVLARWKPDCSIDQSKGHYRTQRLTQQKGLKLPIVSADATGFTDSLDVDFLHVLLEELEEDGYLEYISDITISSANGNIATCLPLMGIKGCFELGCVALAFSLWRSMRLNVGSLVLRGSSHCCDDFCGRASMQSVTEAYNFIGSSINYKKTVVSHDTAIFCGEMYWKGFTVTPVRLNITTLCESMSGTVILPNVRNFIDRCRPSYGKNVMRCVKPLIMDACNRTVGSWNVNYYLPTKVGGVPLLRKEGYGLLDILSKKRTLLGALYNTPLEKIEPDVLTSLFGLVRLGNPVKQPDGTCVPGVTLPTVGKEGFKKRRLLVQELFQQQVLTVNDVLEYYYFGSTT